MNNIIDGFIWDKFDLPLDEDTNSNDFYTIEEFKHLVLERVKELNTLGYFLHPEQIAEYEIRDTKALTAGVKSVADNQYLFVISKYAARKKNEKYLDTIIYHELCHILQLEYLFNSGFIYYADNKLIAEASKIEYVHSVLKVDGAHTPLWKMFAYKLNHTLLINPPVEAKLSTKDIADIFLESTYRPEFYEIDPWITDDFGYNDILKE